MFQDLNDEEEILRRAFQFFDKDGNGEISVTELRTTMHELGDLLTEEEIASFMAIMDVNNDGVIGVGWGGRAGSLFTITHTHAHARMHMPTLCHLTPCHPVPCPPPHLLPPPAPGPLHPATPPPPPTLLPPYPPYTHTL